MFRNVIEEIINNADSPFTRSDIDNESIKSFAL